MKSEITWHKYPDERPQQNYTADYIVCIYDKSSRHRFVSSQMYIPYMAEFNCADDIITHWAELPNPPI